MKESYRRASMAASSPYKKRPTRRTLRTHLVACLTLWFTMCVLASNLYNSAITAAWQSEFLPPVDSYPSAQQQASIIDRRDGHLLTGNKNLSIDANVHLGPKSRSPQGRHSTEDNEPSLENRIPASPEASVQQDVDVSSPKDAHYLSDETKPGIELFQPASPSRNNQQESNSSSLEGPPSTIAAEHRNEMLSPASPDGNTRNVSNTSSTEGQRWTRDTNHTIETLIPAFPEKIRVEMLPPASPGPSLQHTSLETVTPAFPNASVQQGSNVSSPNDGHHMTNETRHGIEFFPPFSPGGNVQQGSNTSFESSPPASPGGNVQQGSNTSSLEGPPSTIAAEHRIEMLSPASTDGNTRNVSNTSSAEGQRWTRDTNHTIETLAPAFPRVEMLPPASPGPNVQHTSSQPSLVTVSPASPNASVQQGSNVSSPNDGHHMTNDTRHGIEFFPPVSPGGNVQQGSNTSIESSPPAPGGNFQQGSNTTSPQGHNLRQDTELPLETHSQASPSAQVQQGSNTSSHTERGENHSITTLKAASPYIQQGSGESNPGEVPSIETHTIVTSPYAYAFLLAGCDPTQPSYRGFLFNILIATDRLRRELKSSADVIVLVRLASGTNLTRLPAQEEGWLNAVGAKVLYLPTATAATEGFSSVQMLKFHVLRLVQYQRVLYIDSDILPLCNLDYLFDLSIKGVLRENLIVAWTKEPANGGFFMLQPDMGAFEKLQVTIARQRESARHLPAPHFDQRDGWGHAMTSDDPWTSFMRQRSGYRWNFYAAYTDQGLFLQRFVLYSSFVILFTHQFCIRAGLLYHYVKFDRRSVSIVIGDTVQTWIPGQNGTVVLKEELQDIFANCTCRRQRQMHLKHPAHADILLKKPPYSDYSHFYSRFKPWEYLDAAEASVVMNSKKARNVVQYWFVLLDELDKRISMGLPLQGEAWFEYFSTFRTNSTLGTNRVPYPWELPKTSK
jgi:hypothetical protein